VSTSPLQLERQAADCAVEAAERLACLRPLALLGVGDGAPQLGVVLVAETRIGEVAQRLVAARHHDVGDGAHDEAAGVLRGRAVVAERDVEHTLGLRVHVAGEIEPGEIEARHGALALRGDRRGVEQRGLAVAELGFLVEAPELRVEHQRVVAGGATGGGRRGRQGETARTRDHDLVGCELDREVVGTRLDRDAVGGGQRVELDEVLRAQQAARRRQRGDNEQRVAGARIGQAVDGARILERDDRGGAAAAAGVADDVERPRRIERDVADGHRPEGAFLGEARELRAIEPDAHHLAVLRRCRRRAVDHAREAAERGQIDPGRRVEYQPERIGATEHRGGRRRLERESELDVVALAASLDRDRPVGGARTRGHRGCGRRGGGRCSRGVGCRRLGSGELRRGGR